jgi:hypothetical protein
MTHTYEDETERIAILYGVSRYEAGIILMENTEGDFEK